MITSKRVWELMSKVCRHRTDDDKCYYYGNYQRIERKCACNFCPILGEAGKEISKIVVVHTCTETKKHFIVTDEKETHYWCMVCAKELNKDGTEKKKKNMESVKGFTMLWKSKQLEHSLSFYQETDPKAKWENGYIIIEAICAGDERNKGISIVSINTGKELTCIMPNARNELWELAKADIRTGIFDSTKICNISESYNPFVVPRCPYK